MFAECDGHSIPSGSLSAVEELISLSNLRSFAFGPFAFLNTGYVDVPLLEYLGQLSAASSQSSNVDCSES